MYGCGGYGGYGGFGQGQEFCGFGQSPEFGYGQEFCGIGPEFCVENRGSSCSTFVLLVVLFILLIIVGRSFAFEGDR